MCGIVGIQLRDPGLEPRLGSLLTQMVGQVAARGPDSAGFGVYGDPRDTPPGWASVSLLGPTATAIEASPGFAGIGELRVRSSLDTTIVSAPMPIADLVERSRAAFPSAVLVGYGNSLTVIKGVGHPDDLARRMKLGSATGWQGVAHTRMATESAVTTAHCHPFSVGPDLCLVHNGSFSNHATIRRELEAQGVSFDSDNDSEVGARFVAAQLAAGVDLETALHRLGERFDGFYTLLVTTADSFAVIRDSIACKPAVVAETPGWVAMASEFRAFGSLPGLASARVFEPEPDRVYVWKR